MTEIWVKVLKPFGYHIEEHKAGDTLKISLIHINDLIKTGHVEIVANNQGSNLPYDEPEDDPFLKVAGNHFEKF